MWKRNGQHVPFLFKYVEIGVQTIPWDHIPSTVLQNECLSCRKLLIFLLCLLFSWLCHAFKWRDMGWWVLCGFSHGWEVGSMSALLYWMEYSEIACRLVLPALLGQKMKWQAVNVGSHWCSCAPAVKSEGVLWNCSQAILFWLSCKHEKSTAWKSFWVSSDLTLTFRETVDT